MIKKAVKFILTIFVSIALVTVGIDAADNYDNLSESIVGRLMFGEEEGVCPEDMVLVLSDKGDFCIDKYEASANEDCPHIDPANEIESRTNLNDTECSVVSKKGAVPWRNLTKVQAMTACAKAGKRLPTMEEWFQAAMGTPDPGTDRSSYDCQVANNWEVQPGLTGSGQRCVSYSGAYDMIGNLWEWVKDEIENGVYDGRELPEYGYVRAVDSKGLATETGESESDEYYSDYFWIKDKGVRNIAKGGYWNNQTDAGIYSTYIVPPPSFVGPGVGFRCVK